MLTNAAQLRKTESEKVRSMLEELEAGRLAIKKDHPAYEELRKELQAGRLPGGQQAMPLSSLDRLHCVSQLVLIPRTFSLQCVWLPVIGW